jgi:hypothetical protein
MLAFAAEAFYPAYNMLGRSDKDRTAPLGNLSVTRGKGLPSKTAWTP